jgi:hypothetical protein
MGLKDPADLKADDVNRGVVFSIQRPPRDIFRFGAGFFIDNLLSTSSKLVFARIYQ